ncbi:hypothetical protein ABZX92_27705 [Lentzea sp. NPDC006480]|uniref:hypothetical protein n=1 Tax=Lentzea sp. NPDC006480 TaxID=3157176 RepID=UPI0033AD92FB
MITVALIATIRQLVWRLARLQAWMSWPATGAALVAGFSDPVDAPVDMVERSLGDRGVHDVA